MTHDHRTDDPLQPEGYEEVERLLVTARRGLAEEKKLSAASWRAIREAMPDRRPTISWRHMGLSAALASALVAVSLIASQSPTGQQAASTPPAITAHAVAPSSVALKNTRALTLVTRIFPGAVINSDRLRAWEGFGRHRFRLAADSSVRVEAWRTDAVELRLLSGSIRCEVKRATANETFRIVSGEVAVDVLGTVFTVSVENGKTQVHVERGRVSVAPGATPPVTVAAGQTWRIAEVSSAANVKGPVATPRPPRTSDNTRKQRLRSVKRNRSKAEPAPTAVTVRPDQAAADAKPKTRDDAPEPTISTDKAPEKRDGEPSKAKTIERVIDVSQVQGTQIGSRGHLRSVIALIQAGRCKAAKSRMRSMYNAVGSDGAPADLFYLMAYCNHVEGKHSAARAFFQKYRMKSRTRSFRIPKSNSETLPVPRASQLAR